MDKIDNRIYFDYGNVLIRPSPSDITSRKNVKLESLYWFRCGAKWSGVPIIAANMDTTGTFETYDILSKYNIITALNKFYELSDYINAIDEYNLDPEYFMVTTGISDSDYKSLLGIVAATGCKWICIDVANGYISSLVDFCKKVRERYPDKIIVAGNVATREKVEELLSAGADVVKIGIGPGSACTTRKKTGVGVPQLSAVIECSIAAKQLGGHIIADGGITCPGDMAKAFGGGASFVMGGGMFAGHLQSPGKIIEKTLNGERHQYKEFYGMSSHKAMDKHYKVKQEYRTSEGRSFIIPYKGDLNNTVKDYLGGLRSTCTYVGANTIQELYNKTKFIRVTQQLNNFYGDSA